MSALLGAMDAAYTWYEKATDNDGLRFFSAGYGQMDSYDRASDDWKSGWEADLLATKLSSALQGLQWNSMESVDGVWEDEATWCSPVSKDLPCDQTRDARMLFVRSAVAGERHFPRTRCIVLLMPALGDQSYTKRHDQCALPLLQLGIASLIYIPPYYGLRRPEDQTRHYINSVADFMLQTMAVIVEGAQVLRWLSDGISVRTNEDYQVPFAVAGSSWGGAMASCAAIVSQRPVACISCMGCASLHVLIDGILEWRVDWEALMNERSQSFEAAKADLGNIFSKITLQRILEDAPHRKAHLVVLHQISAEDDYVIPAAAGEHLFSLMNDAVIERGWSRLHWVSGGHASTFLQNTVIFLPAIEDGVNALCKFKAREKWAVVQSSTPAVIHCRQKLQAMPVAPPTRRTWRPAARKSNVANSGWNVESTLPHKINTLDRHEDAATDN